GCKFQYVKSVCILANPKHCKLKAWNMQKYSFHYLPIKYTYGLIGCLFGLLIIPLVIIALEENNFEAIVLPVLIALMVVWIAPLGYCITKLRKTYPEEIVFNNDGFRSKLFGRVRYEDVRSYRITTGLSRLNREEPASSSHITLQNGPKIRFDLNTKYYEDEIDDFIAFTERVVDDMAAFEQPEEQPNIHQGVSKGTKAEGATSHFNNDHKKSVTDEKRSNLQRDHRDAKASLAKAKD